MTESELFNYTTGRFLANEAHRLRERKRVFDIPGIFSIISKTLSCKAEEIVGFKKLGEGSFYRVFLVTLDTGFQLVARIPYPLFSPKGYALASEVATIDFLRSKGLPIPKVYAYSFTSKNEAQTEYILMEYAEGVDLSKKWVDLKEDEIVSLMEQLAKLESTMMSISFPAGGSIYYAKDLKELSGSEGIPLDESASLQHERFCMGPHVSGPLWYGRREELDVFRGPYKDVESVLVAGAEKELAYLDRFGSPRVPKQQFRREVYDYKKQPPSDHANNLRRYVRLAPWLVPVDDSLNAFCIRHTDHIDSNIKIAMDSSGLKVLSLLDWHHTAVLPLFLHAGTPSFIQDTESELPGGVAELKLPDNFNELCEVEQGWEKDNLRRRFVHDHYSQSTKTYYRTHHKALFYPYSNPRRSLCNNAVIGWQGETIELLIELVDMAVYEWENFAKGGTPCPVVFMHDEVAAAPELAEKIMESDRCEGSLVAVVSYRDNTWVPTDHYEEAKEMGQELKQTMLKIAAEDEEVSEEEAAMVEVNWPLRDVREQELEEYK